MYQIKPLYNAMIWLLYHCGLLLPTASFVTSSLSFGGIGLLLWFWKPSYLARECWLALVIAISLLFPFSMSTLAAFSTPDALCTLLTMATFYCLCRGRGIAWVTCMALLAQLARPDAMILCGALIAYFSLFAPVEWRIEKRDAALCLTFLAMVYALVSGLAGANILERFFFYSFLGRVNSPAEGMKHMELITYINVINQALPMFFAGPRNITMLTWSAAACILYMFKPIVGCKVDIELIFVAWGALAIRILLFPAFNEDRYYFPYFLIMLYCGGEVFAAFYQSLWRSREASHET